ILWLHGPVGSGKSIIAQILSKNFKDRGELAARFSFSDQMRRCRDVKYFITSIAYQLSTSITGMRGIIGSTISEDALILQESTESQLQRLVINPLNLLKQNTPLVSLSPPNLVIVDGLDKC
ncbi:hypothetical protein BDZ94DRAFT_1143026, partial [Collybia nuda]